MEKVKKLFGGIEMTWRRVIIFAVAAGVWTALMAMLVPDGNSFHDIAVTIEWWILLAIIVIVNCKKPLEAALKTFVFFLISQPLVYLIQVPFNSMGWGIFGYYPYWFGITLLTFPGAYIGWYIKKDNWVSGVILAVATSALGVSGAFFVIRLFNGDFPNHLLTALYCLASIPMFALLILKNKTARILGIVIPVVVTVGFTGFMVLRDDSNDVHGTVVYELKDYISTEEEWGIKNWNIEGAEYELRAQEGYDYDGNPSGTDEYVLEVKHNKKARGEHQFMLESESGKEVPCTLKIMVKEGDTEVNSLDCGE